MRRLFWESKVGNACGVAGVAVALVLPVLGAAEGLPVEKVIGLPALGAPIPFSTSDRLLVQAPTSVFRVINGGGIDPASKMITLSETPIAAEISPDDSRLLVSSHADLDMPFPVAKLSFYRIIDGALLHQFTPAEGVESFKQVPSGKYVAFSTRKSVTMVRASDFAEVQHIQFVPNASHDFEFVESENGEYLGITTDSDLKVFREDGLVPVFEYATPPNFQVVLRRTLAIDEGSDTVYAVSGAKRIFRVNLLTGVPSNLDFSAQGDSISKLSFVDGSLRVLSGSVTLGPILYVGFPYPVAMRDRTETYVLEAAETGEDLWASTRTTRVGAGDTGSVAQFPGSMSPDGRYLLDFTQPVKFVSVKTGEEHMIPDGVVAGVSATGKRAGIFTISIPSMPDSARGFAQYALTDESTDLLFAREAQYFQVSALGGPEDSFAAARGSSEIPKIYDEDGNLLRALVTPPDSDGRFERGSFTGWIPGTSFLMAGYKALRIWDTSTGAYVRTLFDSGIDNNVVVFPPSRDGTKLLLSVGNEHSTLLVHETTAIIDGIETASLTIAAPTGNRFNQAVFSPDKSHIYAVVGKYDFLEQKLKAYDAATGDEVASRDLGDITVSSFGNKLDFLSNGDLIFSYADTLSITSEIGSVRIFSTPGLSLIDVVGQGPTHEVLPQTGPLFASRETFFVNVFNAETSRRVARINTYTANAGPLKYSSDDSALLVPYDGTVVTYGLSALKRATPLVDEFLFGIEPADDPDANGDGVVDAADFVVIM